MKFATCLIAAVVSLSALPVAAMADEAVLVAAAADLKFALPAVAAAFEAETGTPVKMTFGSSGQLATQIANGAPFEVFLSADEALVAGLVEKGVTRDAGHLYALGPVALYVPEGSPVTPDENLAGLKAALAAGALGKFAIANPEHAPYGRAARDALQKAGLWATIQPHLVLGENVSQALQFVETGGANGALIAAPLVEAPEFTGKGQHLRVSEALAPPLRQRLVVLKIASPGASAFAAFITSDKGQAILAKYGFSAAQRS
jgi:molybdate transport system substrate-binding protein